MKVEFISAVLLVSKNHERLATFYKDVIGIPLEEEQHGKSLKHYGCELGDLHFAIHPAENFAEESYGVGSVKLAFEVFDMPAHVKKLEQQGVKTLYPPKNVGMMQITAIRDPDGNLVEFTQLSEGWYKHLEKRRAQGHCMIQRYRTLKNQEEDMENLFRSSSFIALQVKNRKEALKFYTETLGVEQAAELDADCGGIVLKHGSVSLVIDEVETPVGQGAVFFEFITPDLASAVEKVKAAGCTLGQATSGKDFRGQMVVDPYGMKFHLYQSVKNA